MGLQGGGVLTAGVSRTRSRQELMRLEREAVILLDNWRAGTVQEFVRLNCRHCLLSPGVTGQRAAEGPVRLSGTHAVSLDGAGTSPSQQFMRFGDPILLRFQFGFAFSTTRGRITWRPSKLNNN